MRNDYKSGDEVRQIVDARPAVFKRYDESRKFCYIQYTDGSKAEMFLPVDNIADTDHHIHEQIVKWRAEGKSRGYDTIYIALDKANRKFKAFYGFGTSGLDPLILKHPELRFIFMWPL